MVAQCSALRNLAGLDRTVLGFGAAAQNGRGVGMMMGAHVFQRTVGSWLLLALVAMVPAAARAEGFFDLYLGAAFPQDNPVDVHTDDPVLNAGAPATDGEVFRAAYPTGRDFNWETSPSVGLRGGYWFEFADEFPSFLGVALDLSYYGAFEDTDFAEINVWATPITPLLMLRLPLGYSEEFPGGRVQPYAAVGPGFTLSAASADLSNLGIGMDDFEDVSFDVGLDARAGLAVQLSHSFALFSEYRYTYLKPHFEDTVDDAGGTGFETSVDIKPKLQTHHLVFGASFRF
jgi:opacity protein-like surface antigen